MTARVTSYEIKISAEHLALLIELWVRAGFVYPHGIRDISVIRLALEDLIQRGRIDVVRHFVERSHRELNSEVTDALFRMTSALPQGYDGRAFTEKHDPDAEFSLFEGQDNADTLIVVFTGQVHRFNYPLPLVHGLLETTGCPILYLKDKSKSVFLEGIGDAPSVADLTGRIRETMTRLNCCRTLVLGSSSGSFAALHYAHDIGASHLICLAGPTCIEPDDQRPPIQRLRQILERLNLDADAVDPRLKDSGCRVRYYYGEANARDSSYARHLAASGFAETIALGGHENHVVLDALCAMGIFQADLAAAVAGKDFPDIADYPALIPAHRRGE
jgi:hypothetical protein